MYCILPETDFHTVCATHRNVRCTRPSRSPIYIQSGVNKMGNTPTYDVRGSDLVELAAHPDVVRIAADTPKTCTTRLILALSRVTSFFSPIDGTPALSFQGHGHEYDVQHTRDRLNADPRLHADELQCLVDVARELNAKAISVERAQTVLRQVLLHRTTSMERVDHTHAKHVLLRPVVNVVRRIRSWRSKDRVVAPSVHTCGPYGLHNYMNSGLMIHWLASIVANPAQDVKSVVCAKPVTTSLPRIARRPVTIPSTGKVIPTGSSVRLMIADVATTTQSVDFLFSSGPGTRTCPFGAFVMRLLYDVQDFLANQPRD